MTKLERSVFIHILQGRSTHYSDVIITAMASQITCVSIVSSTVCSRADLRKHQSSASLAFVRRTHRWPVGSPHNGSVTLNVFPFDDVIMWYQAYDYLHDWPNTREVTLRSKCKIHWWQTTAIKQDSANRMHISWGVSYTHPRHYRVMHPPGYKYVIMVAVDALAPNRRQAISNHHDDSIHCDISVA